MIKQKGFLRLVGGSLGETTFLKSVDGYRAQEKRVVPEGQFKNDPRLQKVRENATEFTRVASGGKTIRSAFNELVKQASDNRVTSRLQKRLHEVINSDTGNPHGHRNLVDGNTRLLEKFEFNGKTDLKRVLFPDFTSTVDRVAGHLTVGLGIVDPLSQMKVPKGTTHFQIVSAASEMNFESTNTVTDYKQSAMLPYGSTPTPVISNVHSLTPASTNILVVVAGIRFYELFNGVMSPVSNGKSNALSILQVSKV